MRQNQELVKLGQKMRARGQAALSGGSVVAAAAQAAPPVPGTANKSEYHPLQVLSQLDTGSVLSGKDLSRAARALTALEIRPQLHGYKQLANQLTRERNEEAQGLGKLGTELQGNVTDVYKNMGASQANSVAAQQAIASTLNQQSAGIASAASADQAKMQAGALGEYTQALQARGAPGGGSAQQQLSDAVTQQQQAQSANSQAAQQFAASQGAGYGQLQAGLAGASQLAGGAAVGGIGRSVIGRVGESNQKYGENIQTALGKLADVKATKGALYTKNLLGLREGEQKYELGKQAVQGNKAKLANEETHDRAEEATNKEKAHASLTSAAASAKNAAVAEYKAKHPNASSGEQAKRVKEIREGTQEVKSLIPGLVAAYGPPESKKELNQFILALNGKASASPTLVQRVVKAWYAKKNPPGSNITIPIR